MTTKTAISIEDFSASIDRVQKAAGRLLTLRPAVESLLSAINDVAASIGFASLSPVPAKVDGRTKAGRAAKLAKKSKKEKERLKGTMAIVRAVQTKKKMPASSKKVSKRAAAALDARRTRVAFTTKKDAEKYGQMSIQQLVEHCIERSNGKANAGSIHEFVHEVRRTAKDTSISQSIFQATKNGFATKSGTRGSYTYKAS